MNHFDPIDGLSQLGYTEREAAFLYEVARHSGYFLRRQYARFLNRQRGALLQDFIAKAQRLAHVGALDCGQRRYLYHLKSKLVYRIAGVEDSQNRRLKGDEQIKIRLMILDYVLADARQRFLATAEEKIEFFTQALHVPAAALPPDPFSATADRYFVDRFPIAAHPSAQPVIFAYFDQGRCTVKPFARYLSAYKNLFTALREFELRYVAVSGTNFRAARREFERLYATPGSGSEYKLLPFGADHLRRFFYAEQLWDENSPQFTPEHLNILKEGEKVYTRSEHRKLKDSWRADGKEFGRALASLGVSSGCHGTFTAQILEEIYPLTGYRGHPGCNDFSGRLCGREGGL